MNKCFKKIAIGKIQPSATQPRKNFNKDDLDNLITSIENYGLLQPILVTQINRNTFEVVAGERRLRAMTELNEKEMPCLVVDSKSSDSLILTQMSLVENILRRDLNPLEEAVSFQYLLENGESYRKLAQKMGVDKSYIQNRVRLLKMPDDLQKLVSENKKTLSHVYELNKVKDVNVRQYHIERIADSGDKYSYLQLRKNIKFKNSKRRDNKQNEKQIYAVWDYDYLRNPEEGSEIFKGNCNSSIIEECIKFACYEQSKADIKKKTLWIPFAGSGTGIKWSKQYGFGKVIATDINPI